MNDIRITYAMIVFNGDFFLRQVLDAIYPHAHQIVINHGCVKYWQERGFITSDDDTAKILSEYPDPENKLTVINVNGNEKTELCSAFMPYIKPETTHLWCIDSDEIFKDEDVYKVKNILRTRNPDAISFKSRTFFGGFDHYLTGFERSAGFKRLLKYHDGARFVNHRPPTLSNENPRNTIGSEEVYSKYGVEFFHYSYVSPKQTKEKVDYYKAVVSKENCIDNYFNEIWLKWVTGCDTFRQMIEQTWKGVHEFKVSYRGACFTEPFNGEHPEVIKRYMNILMEKFNKQLNELNGKS